MTLRLSLCPCIDSLPRASYTARRFGNPSRRCAAGAAAQAPLGLSTGCITVFIARRFEQPGSAIATPFGAWSTHPTHAARDSLVVSSGLNADRSSVHPASRMVDQQWWRATRGGGESMPARLRNRLAPDDGLPCSMSRVPHCDTLERSRLQPDHCSSTRHGSQSRRPAPLTPSADTMAVSVLW